ncbi:MAG TPA: hypothetical protein VKQ30_18900 [Ktedonobacterales bacterium]|nr:hypothetical protein [Ktedonobacterales bacterium]
MPYFSPRILNTDPPDRNPSLAVPIIFEKVEAPRTLWEYHVVTIDPREQEPLGESELAALGADGWLLAGILPHPAERVTSRVSYYFVRQAA